MKSSSLDRLRRRQSTMAMGLSALMAAGLVACGGGDDTAGVGSSATVTAADTPEARALAVATGSASSGATAGQVVPTYHLAPVLPDGPGAEDQDGSGRSARSAPGRWHVHQAATGLATAQLTPENLRDTISRGERGRVSPAVTSSAVTVYTPAQIRAAYAFPVLPALGTTLTAAQAAAQGAGQTIYIVDAYHNPKIASDLAAFNARFGLATCTSTTLSSTTALPLAAQPTSAGCNLTIAYSTASGALSSVTPAYNSGWASEIALDVQWAHAIAPRARIVLIETASSSTADILGGINLAARMGSGVVSMSFGGSEGSWTNSVDTAFRATGMNYVASAGDSGRAMSWPAVSPEVLSVGGTTLTYTTGARTEKAWSGSGGGVSAYTTMPTYQTYVTVPGKSATKPMRAGPDVAYNADPYSGVYVYITPPSGTTGAWYVSGGTSAGAPQWAALLAVGRAQRALAGKALLALPHTLLYQQVGAVAANYAADFLDVTLGSNGTCATCSAVKGYDLVTGLGTPNATGVLAHYSSL